MFIKEFTYFGVQLQSSEECTGQNGSMKKAIQTLKAIDKRLMRTANKNVKVSENIDYMALSVSPDCYTGFKYRGLSGNGKSFMELGGDFVTTS
jgi:hypothetical protein